MGDAGSEPRKLLAVSWLLVLAGACATLAQPALAPAVAYLAPSHAQGTGPYKRIAACRERSARGLRRRDDLSEVDPPEADRKVLERMFEVQAVIARTYADRASRPPRRSEGFDVCATTHCQLYEPARLRCRGGRRAREAAVRTAGQIAVVCRCTGPRGLSRRLRRPHQRRHGRLVRTRPAVSPERLR